jgi:O-antigen/teichoic acid export membrane protein
MISAMVGRLDILFVFLFVGAAGAGNYSVALTVAGLVGLAPFSFTYAAFPRLAYLDDQGSRELALIIWRRGTVASIAMACLVGAASPILIPLLFGSGFQPAITPSLILLAGGVCYGGQSMLARALAARGDPNLLVRTYGLTLVVMVALDFLLIPVFGIIGAAVASSISALAGLALCVVRYKRDGITGSEMIPRWADCVALLRTLRSIAAEPARWRERKAARDALAESGTPPAPTR